METEVKIRVADREAFERKLPALGFTRVTARTLERNTLYDTPDRHLRNSRQILRIRQYGSKWVVTHKSVPSGLTRRGTAQEPRRNRDRGRGWAGPGARSSRPSASVPCSCTKNGARNGRTGRAIVLSTKRRLGLMPSSKDRVIGSMRRHALGSARAVHHAQLRSHFRAVAG